jgi:hypothetical protein
MDASLETVGVGPEAVVLEGKGGLLCEHDRDLLLASRERPGTRAEDCIFFSAAVWDHVCARRAGMFRVGVLTDGFSEEEQHRSGPFRVYRNVADRLHNLDELGIPL